MLRKRHAKPHLLGRVIRFPRQSKPHAINRHIIAHAVPAIGTYGNIVFQLHATKGWRKLVR